MKSIFILLAFLSTTLSMCMEVCPYENCGLIFKNRFQLARHNLEHRKQRYVCDASNCSEDFATERELLNHQWKVHQPRRAKLVKIHIPDSPPPQQPIAIQQSQNPIQQPDVASMQSGRATQDLVNSQHSLQPQENKQRCCRAMQIMDEPAIKYPFKNSLDQTFLQYCDERDKSDKRE
jgi:hypothetical protein